jgi:dethiobiotin synthetase
VTTWLITGTDTDVGKTVVTAAIAAAWRQRGLQPRAIKPLATGSTPPGSDAEQLGMAAGHEPAVHTCLPQPASPERAAIEAQETIDMAAVVSWVQGQHGTPLLVEGVGGFAVPIDSENTIADFAIQLGHPVLIVAANRLGVLNHTLLTVQAVKAAGLPIAGVVLNNAFTTTPELQDWNKADICRWIGPDIPVAVATRVQLPDGLAKLGEAILTQLGQ